jgi:pyruvate/2-oxoglutarate dehydrogenase complex dihydrolipoamide acyltransferase (E2) component
MPNYEVQHNSHRTSDGRVHEPGSVVRLTEAQARPFVFKLRRLEDEPPPQLEPAPEMWDVAITDVRLAETVPPLETATATPAARRLVDEEGLDLRAIAGTGKDGRVTTADVRAAMEG